MCLQTHEDKFLMLLTLASTLFHNNALSDSRNPVRNCKGTKEQWYGSFPNPTSNEGSRKALALEHEHISQDFYLIKRWTRKKCFPGYALTFLQMHRAHID